MFIDGLEQRLELAKDSRKRVASSGRTKMPKARAISATPEVATPTPASTSRTEARDLAAMEIGVLRRSGKSITTDLSIRAGVE